MYVHNHNLWLKADSALNRLQKVRRLANYADFWVGTKQEPN